jgi:MIP family channel proteins
MVMIAAVGHISGAHFNPAVTLAFALTRHFDWRELPGYWLGQFAGAISAAAILLVLFGPVAGLGANRPAGSALQALGLEVLLTAALMFVITAVATDTRAVGQMAAVAIGGTIALNSLWAGPISGASMNPARSFGPALVAGEWGAHWVYWLGPLLGAVIGAALYQALRMPARSVTARCRSRDPRSGRQGPLAHAPNHGQLWPETEPNHCRQDQAAAQPLKRVEAFAR